VAGVSVTAESTGIEGPSGVWRGLALALYALPFLLILAALVPLDFDFVPYEVADTWHNMRGAVAICGVMLVFCEAVIYFAFGLG
jgi:hypothetical protein